MNIEQPKTKTQQVTERAAFGDLMNANHMTVLDAALLYARLGFRVVMLEPNGKAPHFEIRKGWTDTATTDESIIRDWYTRQPDANVGIMPGENIILDLDVKDPDADGVALFEGLHEDVMGPSAVTPSGGIHRVFRRTDDERLRNYSPRGGGFDLLVQNRQAVVAPSVVVDGNGERKKYLWTQGGEPAPFPKSCMDKVEEVAQSGASRDKYGAEAPTNPGLGEAIIKHDFEIDLSDRSVAIYTLARDLYRHHGERSDKDILTTVWSVPDLQQAALDRRSDRDSALEWMWKYCVYVASGYRINLDPIDAGGYDPRPPAMRALLEGIEPAPWEGETSEPSLFNRIQPLAVLKAKYADSPAFVIDKWFPKGVLTTIYGKDGTGKTLFMQRVCTALATGKPVLERKKGKAIKCLMILAEDLMAAVMSRQKAIERDLALTKQHETILCKNLIMPDGLMEVDVKLMTFNRELVGAKTPFFEQLEAYIESARPEMVVLDPISDIYADEENRREKVSQFMRALNATASKFDIALVLIGHPAKASDSEYSGSGAWSSKSRSRVLMEATNDEANSPVMLKQRKASYGPRANDVHLMWEGGVLRELSYVEAEALTVVEQEDLEDVIRNCLVQLLSKGRTASASSRAGNFLGLILLDAGWVTTPERPDDVKKFKRRVVAALEQMERKGKVLLKYMFDGSDGLPKIKDGSRRYKEGIRMVENPTMTADKFKNVKAPESVQDAAQTPNW